MSREMIMKIVDIIGWIAVFSFILLLNIEIIYDDGKIKHMVQKGLFVIFSICLIITLGIAAPSIGSVVYNAFTQL